MKKIGLAILFLGLGVSNSFADDFTVVASTEAKVKNRPYKFSLGVSAAHYPPFQGSASFLYNPNKSIGSLGFLVGTYRSARLEGLDASVTVGYWSNDNKEKMLGWHGYFGLGMSSAESRDSGWKVENSVVSTKTFGLGADIYFSKSRTGVGIPVALVLEGLVVQRSVNLVSGSERKVLDKDIFHLDLANDSRLQVGLRTWF